MNFTVITDQQVWIAILVCVLVCGVRLARTNRQALGHILLTITILICIAVATTYTVKLTSYIGKTYKLKI